METRDGSEVRAVWGPGAALEARDNCDVPRHSQAPLPPNDWASLSQHALIWGQTWEGENARGALTPSDARPPRTTYTHSPLSSRNDSSSPPQHASTLEHEWGTINGWGAPADFHITPPPPPPPLPTEADLSWFTDVHENVVCPICWENPPTPLRLKTCGHRFCSTCLATQVASEARNADKCSVCRENMYEIPFEGI
jgi:hypothetical protein